MLELELKHVQYVVDAQAMLDSELADYRNRFADTVLGFEQFSILYACYAEQRQATRSYDAVPTSAVCAMIGDSAAGEKVGLYQLEQAQCYQIKSIKISPSSFHVALPVMKVVLNVVKAYADRVLLWFAIPCTGGLPICTDDGQKKQ